ncbi:hypothetical protein Fleli_2529 [Bernardetia litoralis DSM 6794]|uniref:RiboL-PSP-HEPN domain-containing protein n=1 Tax=Bernardetia litoralis (strain ATCC 23117 / DSM 6794 / NBRC 15988 / NCIMB 1366 / Fx l1 / Sio-4) TaxID=880071 RepID=I4ALQ9_BERLS|nr:MAE_28990/MAE_18760 family HEPN-like nuclease [Bernardetia litoralis]AFM04894.1 hypothetical protein Fleli_2529 [Bernardetia litoralis DSM 6794]
MTDRKIEEVQKQLDEESTWRKKEITYLFNEANTKYKRNNKRNKEDTSSFFIRTSIVSICGHWEGFVKKSALLYLKAVASEELSYKELALSFSGAFLKINQLGNKRNKKTKFYADLVYKLENETFNISITNSDFIIDTESNLKYIILEDILFIINIPTIEYETKRTMIDDKLLKYRNKIAHGERDSVSFEEYKELKNGILELIEILKTDILNNLILKKYLR